MSHPTPAVSPTLSERIQTTVTRWHNDSYAPASPIGLVVYERYEGRFGVHVLAYHANADRVVMMSNPLTVTEKRYLDPYVTGYKAAVPTQPKIGMADLPLADQLTLLMHTNVFNVEVKHPRHLEDVCSRTTLRLADSVPWQSLPQIVVQASLIAAFGGAR